MDFGASGKIAHHDVVPLAGFGVGFEAEREAGMPGGGIFGAEVAIEEGLTGSLALVTIGLDLVGRGGIGVGAASGDQFLSPGVVDGFALGLEIRSGGSADNGALVPL